MYCGEIRSNYVLKFTAFLLIVTQIQGCHAIQKKIEILDFTSELQVKYRFMILVT